ncbi:MAG: hypothetical protein ABEJ65_11200, partial [bacterium]
FWQAVRNDELELGSWEAYVVYEPHVHIIGTAGERWSGDEQLEEGQDVGTAATVFKRIGDLDGLGDVVGCYKYLLTHCSVPRGSQAIVWTGALAYNQFSGASDSFAAEVDQRIANVSCSSSLRKVVESEDPDSEIECEKCGEKGTQKAIWDATDLLRDRSAEVRAGPALQKAYMIAKSELPAAELPDTPDGVDWTDVKEVKEWIFE